MWLPSRADEATDAELNQLVGIWALEETAYKGELPVKQPVDKAMRLVILDTGEYYFRAEGALCGGTQILGPASSPKAIDLKNTVFTGAGKSWTDLAVYEVKDGVLTLSKAPKGVDRPESLKPAANAIVQKWRRVSK